MYTIVVKQKNDTRNIWSQEIFLTSGRVFLSYTKAQYTKKEIQKMCNTLKYKVIKV